MSTIKSNEFHASFMLSKTKAFNVSYYTLGSNKEPYFSTSADVFNRPKTDWNQCGQCQNEVLKQSRKAMQFYKKWDEFHLKKLTNEQYQELINDIEGLFALYPYILKEKTDNELYSIPFFELKKFSMQVYR